MSKIRKSHATIWYQVGFSLVELLLIVTVLAIVTSIALPNFRNMMRSNRLTAIGNELNAVLQSARMEAIRLNGRVDVCPSSNGTACNGNDWQRVIVISRKNGNDEVLRDVVLAGSDITIIPSPSVSANNLVWYQSDGFARMGAATSPTRTGTIAVCAAGLSGNNARNVQINMGRVSVTRVANSTCSAPGDT